MLYVDVMIDLLSGESWGYGTHIPQWTSENTDATRSLKCDPERAEDPGFDDVVP